MKVKRGDIFWIEKSEYRPAVGSMQKPGRPGIIVSNDANNACSLTYEIVYLTGKPKKAMPTHCTINSVPKPGTALCEQVTTVSNEQIRDYVGHCTKEEMEQIDQCIAISLGLPDPDEVPNLYTDEEREDYLAVIRDLQSDLAVANARADQLQKMYDNLLVLAMGK